jgi:hypothetical protein
VITGFNTDIPHEGVTYHVQTEDKGLDTPLILSLVYVGGAIIAAKRTPYEDLLAKGFDEKVLAERLSRQHKLICAAIRAGRIAELKRMGAGGAGAEGAAAPPAPAPAAKAKAPRKKKSGPLRGVSGPQREVSRNGAGEAALPAVVEPAAEAAAPVAAEETAEAASGGAGKAAGDEIVILTTLVDEIAALGGEDTYSEPPRFVTAPLETTPLHEEFYAPTQPLTPPPPPPEPVIEEPPVLLDSPEGLYLALLDDEGDFRAGELVMVKLYVGRDAYGERPVAGAQVTVKVLGTTFRPLILTGETDETGVAVVRALLPRFTSGRAAIIIRAADGEEAVEMRRIIHQT